MINPGGNWNNTIIYQAIDLQKQYNLILSKISEHTRMMAFPKILVAKQHGIQKGSWTVDAGEMGVYTAIPGVPEPKPYNPPPILGDLWRMLNVIDDQMDLIFQIRPVSEGAVGGATSGFQTSLLQEAADTVHGFDIRGFELTIERSREEN